MVYLKNSPVRCLLPLLVLFFLALAAFRPAACFGAEMKTKIVPEMDAETVGRKRSGFLFIPFPIYTPETKAALILTAMYHFRENKASHPSTLMGFLAYSQLNQFRVGGISRSYLGDGLAHATVSIGFANWPDKFFGIGTDNTKDDEENFTSESVDLRLALQYCINGRLKAGFNTEFRNYEITKTESGRMLDSSDIQGAQGGDVFGVGPIATWDSRDDFFFPRKGFWGQVSALMFLDSPGDYQFQRYRLDMRQYMPIGEDGVIAVHKYINIVRGDIPFLFLSKIGDMGGVNLLRGYYSGFFREKDVAAVQVEYRTHLWQKVGGAVFGGVGAIGPDLPRGRDLAVKPAGGVGLRYRVGGDEAINLRLDFAVGKDSTGIYFNILESF